MDTAISYASWVDGDRGGQSEALLGRWRSRGVGDEVVVATTVGRRPVIRHGGSLESLSTRSIREAASRSCERLGVARLDLLYAHLDDHGDSQTETVEAFAGLIRDGMVGLVGPHGLPPV